MKSAREGRFIEECPPYTNVAIRLTCQQR